MHKNLKKKPQLSACCRFNGGKSLVKTTAKIEDVNCTLFFYKNPVYKKQGLKLDPIDI